MKKVVTVFMISCLLLSLVIQVGSNKTYAATVSFNPTEDAYTLDGANYNTTQLKIRQGTSVRIAYLKFTVTGLSGTVVSTKLKLNSYGDGGTPKLKAFDGLSNSWTEDTIIGSNAPGLGTERGHYDDFIADGDWFTVDLDNYITSDGTYTIVLTANNSGNDVFIASSEKSGREPILEIETSSGSDVTAPGAVKDLVVGSATSSSLNVTWTAPGDNGTAGTAASYDLRYSTSASPGGWSTATQVTNEPLPALAGTSQSKTVSGLLPNTTYYFALKTTDDASNVSGLSNIASSTTLSSGSGGVKAFPGAEGFGKNTRGAYALYEQTNDPGDLPVIMKVTNLNNNGSGSLRSCAEATMPRVCLVMVDGLIDIGGMIEVESPYMTLAGQTAPGDGIIIKGNSFVVRASEVIIRNIQFRPGRDAGSDKDSASIIANLSDINNVIFDHSSFSWARDENLALNSMDQGNLITNVTVQRSILSEGLEDHSMGMLMNSPNGLETISNISVIGNLIANNEERYPNIGGNGSAHNVEIINNIGYNWYAKAAAIYHNSTAHFIGNLFLPGPETSGTHRAVELHHDGVELYYQGNTATYSIRNSSSPTMIDGDNGGSYIFTPSGYTHANVSQIDTVVADRAGAFPRGDVDERIVYEYRNDEGMFITHEDEVGGYPTMATGTNPTDTDGDGMPDAWETAEGLNLNSASDAHLDSGDGYSNLEKYMNSFFDADGIYQG